MIEKTSNADVIANNSNLAKTALDGNKTYIARCQSHWRQHSPPYKNSKGEWASHQRPTFMSKPMQKWSSAVMLPLRWKARRGFCLY